MPRAQNGSVTPWLEGNIGFDGENCLLWPFARNVAGYGNIYYKGRYATAHRVMCTLTHGEPPTKVHQVAHSCGNGHLGCVNPKHLRWATPAENCADTQATGNHDRGENNPAAKLLEDDVVSIRYLCRRTSGCR